MIKDLIFILDYIWKFRKKYKWKIVKNIKNAVAFMKWSKEIDSYYEGDGSNE